MQLRKLKKIGATGIEPALSCSKSMRGASKRLTSQLRSRKVKIEQDDCCAESLFNQKLSMISGVYDTSPLIPEALIRQKYLDDLLSTREIAEEFSCSKTRIRSLLMRYGIPLREPNRYHNDYLAHDGVLDVLEDRQRSGSADRAARERYSKHVKAVFQVGEARSPTFAHVLNYPIEIVPVENPYDLSVGDALTVRVLLRGAPLASQLVYASYDGHHVHDTEGDHAEAFSTRTNALGMASIALTATGAWYVRLIHMEESEEDGIDYESNWATLTFEIR